MEELLFHSLMLNYYFPKGFGSLTLSYIVARSRGFLGKGRHGEMCLIVKMWVFMGYHPA